LPFPADQPVTLTGDTPDVNWRMTRLGWLIAAALLAVPFAYGMLFISAANSCGGLDSGPNPGAEERFCGYGSDEPTDYSDLFVFVNLIPAGAVLIGGLLATLGFSRSLFFGGIGVGVISAFLIFWMEP
jgi:hypothetical protein